MTQVFLEEMEGCHLFLSPPFVMHSGIRGSTKTFRKDDLPLILSAGFRNPFGIGLVGSGFHSFRWAFALALQKLLLLVGLTTAVPFLGCSPEFIWQLPVLAWLSSALLFPWNFRRPLAVSCEALFPLLSRFRYIWKLRKVTTFSAIFARWHKNRNRKVASRWCQYSCHRYTPRKLSAPRLPAPHQSLPDQESVPQIYSAKAQRFPPPYSAPVPPQPAIRATDILRESSALPASLLRTSPSPTRNPCHRYTPRKLSAPRLPAPHQSLPDQESVPQIYSAKAQPFSPPGSAPVPPRPEIRATDIPRESSALLASLLRTSPSPTSNPCHRYTPRKLSALRYAQTRVPSISPLTRGNQ